MILASEFGEELFWVGLTSVDFSGFRDGLTWVTLWIDLYLSLYCELDISTRRYAFDA